MNIKTLLLILAVVFSTASCITVTSPGREKVVPAMDVQLKVTSLNIKSIQEQGVLGVEDGDEISMVYAINAYDASGELFTVNTGFWGTRTHKEGAVIAAEEFDKIKVGVPKDGSVIVAFSLIEIDDYRGERRIIAVKKHTKKEKTPKRSDRSTFDKDKELMPTELVERSLDIAGYRNFAGKHLTLSSNDYLGGTKLVLDASALDEIQSKKESGRQRHEIEGSQINESFQYELKYDIDVTRRNTATK